MIKTFTLVNVEKKLVSPKKGYVTYHIKDESGDYTRTVTGTVTLDDNKRIKGVSANHKREVPLIETLSQLKVNDEFTLDFGSYNKYFNREKNKTVNEEAYESVMTMSDIEDDDNSMTAKVLIIGSGIALALFGVTMLMLNLS